MGCAGDWRSPPQCIVLSCLRHFEGQRPLHLPGCRSRLPHLTAYDVSEFAWSQRYLQPDFATARDWAFKVRQHSDGGACTSPGARRLKAGIGVITIGQVAAYERDFYAAGLRTDRYRPVEQKALRIEADRVEFLRQEISRRVDTVQVELGLQIVADRRFIRGADAPAELGCTG